MHLPEIDAARAQQIMPGTGRWLSANGAEPPARFVDADDRMSAKRACELVCRGTGLLWRGDFHQARQLLAALSRRLRRSPQRPSSVAEAFVHHRREQSRRARALSLVLVRIEPGHVLALRRAPDIGAACQDVYGAVDEPYVVPLRELLGVISAREWRQKGVSVPALGARIHPHYGVFAPTRNEYVDLVADAPLPPVGTAFDIGTGTGVLAAVLARRGVPRVVGTDSSARAIRCAEDNARRLGLTGQFEAVRTDLFPPGRAQLVVCNPPWIPAEPHSALDHAVYDPGSRMLLGFLDGLADHLQPGGEGWLILSDLAERLGLRTRSDLLNAVRGAGLRVLARSDTGARHPKAAASGDPFHAARASEIISLWRLARPEN
ncbi:Methylase of polypeptide chain release factors [Saccharopolyspora antimicrobica]|uniref:Methylase of polypeptide chain release factors n=2 Tax=Saccharopolyspora antimicrobica TaxID=455193 RepID=A0A1I5HQ78_9PSEU|nr:methylase of polypeptide subunit release factors [Saccharopolyspora antimicrobica]SFO50423.1 Methylase of polypeptide chain release factors [Saccharopolyspora antimicrobica]